MGWDGIERRHGHVVALNRMRRKDDAKHQQRRASADFDLPYASNSDLATSSTSWDSLVPDTSSNSGDSSTTDYSGGGGSFDGGGASGDW